MIDYKRFSTSAEVWAVIHAHHPELKVFGSYSAPNGDQFRNPSKGRMLTSYGFEGGHYPVIEAETTWDIDASNPGNRTNEMHKYWLCIAIRDED